MSNLLYEYIRIFVRVDFFMRIYWDIRLCPNFYEYHTLVRTVKELKRSDSLCLSIADLVQSHGNIRVRKVQWDADSGYVIGTGIGLFPFKWTFVVL